MTTMPDKVRRGLFWAAVALAAVAFLGNSGHVFEFATSDRFGGADAWQGAVAAFLPDVLLLASIVRLRYHRGSAASWLGLALAVASVSWAAWATAPDRAAAKAVAAFPMLVACIVACLLEARPAAPAVAAVPARVKRAAKPPTSSARAGLLGEAGEETATPRAAPPLPDHKPRPDHAGILELLTATAPVDGETDPEKRARLGTAYDDCVKEVADLFTDGHKVTAKHIAHAYGAASTWSKTVRAEAFKAASRPYLTAVEG